MGNATRLLRKYRSVVFATLIDQEMLWRYIADIDSQMQEMFDSLVGQMIERECVTEQVKNRNEMLWAQMMNTIRNRAIKIMCK